MSVSVNMKGACDGWWGNSLPKARRSRAGTYIEPEYDVTIGWVARAAGVLLVPGRVDDDRVVEGACWSQSWCISVSFHLYS